MPASDGIIIDQAAISATNFNVPHFEDGFTTMPELPTQADPNNTGKFDDEHWLIGKQLEGGWADGPDLCGIAVNKERQIYTSNRRPSPDGWSPFEITSEGLAIRAREVPDTPLMKAWAIAKRYGEKPADGSNGYGGQDYFDTDFANAADIAAVMGADYTIEPDGRIRGDRYPMKWQSGILHTNNERASVNQGRFEVVVKVPAGSIYSSSGSVTDQFCAFAAAWLIQQFKVGHGRNLQALLSGLTHYPFTGSKLLNELDPGEFGGFDPNTNHNSRHVHDGTPLKLLSDGEAKYIAGLNMQMEFVRIICDITYEKIGMAIGPADGICKYTRVIDTPKFFKQTRREYELVSAQSADVVMVNGIEVERGDLEIDGVIQTPDMSALLNVAMDGRWLRERMIWERQTILNRGYNYPAFAMVDGLMQCEMIVRSIALYALTDAKFLKHDGGFYEPHKNGTRNAGTVTTPSVTTSSAPATGGGIRFAPGHEDGILTWTLEDKSLAGQGQWQHDFGADAVVIGGDRGDQLTLNVSDVVSPRNRLVWFQPDSAPTVPQPVITYGPVEGVYTASR